MSYDVRWMPRARRQAAETQGWWMANRELAPTMFRDELARVLGLLQQNPELGIRVKGREVRRLLLPETERFLYYRVITRGGERRIVEPWVSDGRDLDHQHDGLLLPGREEQRGV